MDMLIADGNVVFGAGAAPQLMGQEQVVGGVTASSDRL